MNSHEYKKMSTSIFPQHLIEEYNLLEKVYKGCVWIKIRRSICGLPHSGKLANEYLQKKIAPYGYYEVTHSRTVDAYIMPNTIHPGSR